MLTLLTLFTVQLPLKLLEALWHPLSLLQGAPVDSFYFAPVTALEIADLSLSLSLSLSLFSPSPYVRVWCHVSFS
ncbi:MAG: hypothetical protein KTM48_02405 [Wolbachia endosymbiont of Pissodes strobi]|nr:hypothetical protein [Wolbachia endosymbiont of Pissodes strobi]